MKILAFTAGAARMYCGSCLRDNALAAELKKQGHDIVLLPLYTPTRTDESNVSEHRLFLNGISVCLDQQAAFFRKVHPLLDRLWDLASLTKVIATTSSLMKLFEEGRFRLNDKVTDYLPEFQGGTSDITLRNLFTHFSGLPQDVPLKPEWTGNETGLRLAYTDKPTGPPGLRHVYSDINFILLGELVHRLSGQTLAEYSRQNIFLPIGMKETTFQPPAAWVPRIAPTERPDKDSEPLRGVVHDPTARNMGGIAGHAGLFSTADDLARFAQMMLNGGELD